MKSFKCQVEDFVLEESVAGVEEVCVRRRRSVTWSDLCFRKTVGRDLRQGD